MKIIDISLPINRKTLVHPSEEFLKIEPNRKFEIDGVRTSKITIGSHTGTHVDATAHFVDKGTGVDQIDLKKLLGKCQLIQIPNDVNSIEKEHIKERINSKRILFKTKNSDLLNKPYTKSFTSLGVSGAEYLINKGVLLIGIDYIGIEASGSPEHPVHKKLLDNAVVIIEGLNLVDTEPGDYELIVLPLKLKDLDGSPARAVLIKN